MPTAHLFEYRSEAPFVWQLLTAEDVSLYMATANNGMRTEWMHAHPAIIALLDKLPSPLKSKVQLTHDELTDLRDGVVTEEVLYPLVTALA